MKPTDYIETFYTVTMTIGDKTVRVSDDCLSMYGVEDKIEEWTQVDGKEVVMGATFEVTRTSIIHATFGDGLTYDDVHEIEDN